MTERDYTKLGLFLVLGFGLALGAAVFYGLRSQDRETLDYVTYFDEQVGGLAEGAPVKFRGVDVGVVDAISVAPGGSTLIEVGFQVYVDQLVRIGLDVDEVRHAHDDHIDPDKFIARMKQVSNPVTGISYLLITVPKSLPPVDPLPFEPARTWVPSVPSTGAQLADALDQVTLRLPTILDDLDRTLVTVEKAVTDARIGTLSTKAEAVLDRLDTELAALGEHIEGAEITRRSAELGALMGASSSAIAATDANLERLLGSDGQLEGTLGDLRAAIEAVEAARTAAAVREGLDRAGRALDAFTLVARDAEALVPGVQALLVQLRSLVRTLDEQPEALLFGPSLPEETP